MDIIIKLTVLYCKHQNKIILKSGSSQIFQLWSIQPLTAPSTIFYYKTN